VVIVGLLLLPASNAFGASEAAQAGAQTLERVEAAATDAQQTVEEAARTFLSRIQRDPWTWLHLIGAGASLAFLWMTRVIRPGSLHPTRTVDAHPSIVWFGAGALAFISMVVGSTVMVAFVDSSAKSGLKGSALLQIGSSLASIPTSLILLRLLNMSAPGSGMSGHSKDIVKGLIALALAWPIVQATALITSWIQVRMGGTVPAEVAHSTLAALRADPNNPWAWSLVMCAVISAPITEEFVFRGGLQSALLRAFHSPWISIVLTSIGFAAVHLGDPLAGNWHSITALLVLGIALGVAYERTKSFVVPLTMHAGFNVINIALTLMKG